MKLVLENYLRVSEQDIFYGDYEGLTRVSGGNFRGLE